MLDADGEVTLGAGGLGPDDLGCPVALPAGLDRLGAPLTGAAGWLQVPVLGGEDVVGNVRPAAVLTR